MILFFFLIFFPLSLQTKLHSPKPPSLFHQLQSSIDSTEPISKDLYQSLLSYFRDRKYHTTSTNHTLLSKALTYTGKLHLYGLLPNADGDLRKAVFYFKLAASLGSPEALYFESFLTFFQLDGVISLRHDLDSLSKLSARLAEYLTKRHKVNSFISAYFSSLQNHTESTLSMAYKYVQGLNGDTTNFIQNCPSAAMYYHEINKGLYLDHEQIIPKFLEKKRLSFETLDAEIRSGQPSEHEEIEFLRMSANQNKIDAILKLAYYYFYGLKGLNKDYEVAFEHFSRAALLGDASAKSSLGYMHMKGLGTPKNYKAAYKEFNAAVLKKDPRAKCGMGQLFMNGWGVERNEKSAMNYYKEAAETGNAEGQYLYGTHLMSMNQKALFKQALESINLSAQQGHAAAMYALGLLHLDGNHLFYSCEIAVKMLRSAAERGPWASKMKTGHLMLTRDRKRASFLLYLEAAYIGMTNAGVNAALLADKFEVLRQEELDFTGVDGELASDAVFQILREKEGNNPSILKAIYKPFDWIFDDLLQIFSDREVLKELMSKRSVNNLKTIAKQAYSIAKLENDAFAYLRLGDFYYYGIAVKQDYVKAYKAYAEVLNLPVEELYKAQAYFNLAYMNQYGQGTPIDRQRSWALYNQSYHHNKYALFSVKISQFLLGVQEGEGVVFGLEAWSPTARDFYVAVIGVGAVVWIAMMVLRVRQRNLIESLTMKME